MIVFGLIGQSGISPSNHLIVTEIDDGSGVGVFFKVTSECVCSWGRGLAEQCGWGL